MTIGVFSSAPKVRNATAWGHAPGNLPANSEALKARNVPKRQGRRMFRSAKGAECNSLGQRPRKGANSIGALKARDKASIPYISLIVRHVAIFQEASIFLLKRYQPVVFLLVINVLLHRSDFRLTH